MFFSHHKLWILATYEPIVLGKSYTNLLEALNSGFKLINVQGCDSTLEVWYIIGMPNQNKTENAIQSQDDE